MRQTGPLKRPHLAFAAASLVPLLLLACAENRAQVQAKDDVEGQAGVQQHRLEVPPEATSLELMLEVETTGGEIAWTLTRPG